MRWVSTASMLGAGLFFATTLFAQQWTTFPVASPWAAVTTIGPFAADIDGNGADDLVLVLPNSVSPSPTTVIAAFMNPGVPASPALTNPVALVPYWMIPGLQSVLFAGTADFDADGSADFVLGVRTTSNTSAFYALVNSGGVFVSANLIAQFPLDTGLAQNSFVGDFDGDGITDVGRLDFATGVLTLHRFVGGIAGTLYTEAVTIPQASAAFRVGDFNGDGLDDVSFGPEAGGTMRQLFGAAGGAFSPSIGGVTYLLGLLRGDFNNDGRTDFAMPRVVAPTQVFMAEAQPSGGFAPPVVTPLTIPSTPVAALAGFGATAADADADGYLDLITTMATSVTGGSWWMLHIRNPGPIGMWGASTTYTLISPTGYGAVGIPGDFDGDGDTDIIWPRSLYTASAYIYMRNDCRYGVPCFGAFGEPTITADPAVMSATAWTVTIDGGIPWAPCVILASTAPAVTPGCILVDTSPGALLMSGGLPPIVSLDAQGRFVVSANLAAAPALAGQTIYLQCAVLDGTSPFSVAGVGFSTSRGRAIRFY